MSARCQCDPRCNKKPAPGAHFCKDHEKHCPRRAPLSGSETLYDPAHFNKFKGIQEATNCYAYALNYDVLPSHCTKQSCSVPFPQPGRTSGYPKWSKVSGKRCPDVMARALGDIKGSRVSTFHARCPKGMRKIAFIADEDEDYHVIRQDSNGFWSHKPGSTKVTAVDAQKSRIYDPSLASWKYPQSGLNYDEFCGYMCVPAKKKHTLKRGGKRRQRTKKRHA